MNENNSRLDTLWINFLVHYKSVLNDENIFNTFYANSKLHALTQDTATILVESMFCKHALLQNIVSIEQAIKSALTLDVKCLIVTESDLQTNQLSSIPIKPIVQQTLLPEFCFDTFVVGSSNKEAHAASLATAITPGKFITPLFLYGNSGLGKTHLLHAIGNYIIEHDPNMVVYYLPCVEFVNEYVRSIRENKMDKFNDKFFNVDVLLVDDIQFLAGKEKSHEVFFHIFNHLVNNKKQIVLTSDQHPEEMKGLENRLVSRFSSGLSIGIDSPEFETSVAILQKKMDLHNVDIESIEEDVLYYMATRFSSDVRRLEGALNRLLFYSITIQDSKMITMEIALDAFKDFDAVINITKGKVSADKIKKIVSDYYNLTPSQLISKSRTSNIATPRHIAMYLCRDILDLPFIKIGEAFGNRDHSTVMSACDKISRGQKNNDHYKRAIIELKALLKES